MAEEVIKGRIVFDMGKVSGPMGTGGKKQSLAGAVATGNIMADAVNKLIGPFIDGILSAVKPLAKILGMIGKMLGMILRPIMMIFSIALMPLLMMLRPIAKIINIMFRPYLKKAMEAMRTGAQLQREGKPLEAMAAFQLGSAFLLQPILDIMITVSQAIVQGIQFAFFEGVKLIITGIGLIATLIAKAFFGEETAEMVAGEFNKLLTKATDIEIKVIQKTGELFQGLKGAIDAGLTGALEYLQGKVGEDSPLKIAIMGLADETDSLTTAFVAAAERITEIEQGLLEGAAKEDKGGGVGTEGVSFGDILKGAFGLDTPGMTGPMGILFTLIKKIGASILGGGEGAEETGGAGIVGAMSTLDNVTATATTNMGTNFDTFRTGSVDPAKMSVEDLDTTIQGIQDKTVFIDVVTRHSTQGEGPGFNSEFNDDNTPQGRGSNTNG